LLRLLLTDFWLLFFVIFFALIMIRTEQFLIVVRFEVTFFSFKFIVNQNFLFFLVFIELNDKVVNIILFRFFFLLLINCLLLVFL